VDHEAIARTFMKTPHCMIATATTSGEPWLSVVFFNFDATYNIVWESQRNARHSFLLEHNPAIAFYLESDSIEGALYASGQACQVEPSRVEDCLGVFLNGPHQRQDPARTPEDYGPHSPLGLYEAKLQQLFVLRRTNRDGYDVEERQPVDLAKLRAAGS